jgi:hypothetical protein
VNFGDILRRVAGTEVSYSIEHQRLSFNVDGCFRQVEQVGYMVSYISPP